MSEPINHISILNAAGRLITSQAEDIKKLQSELRITEQLLSDRQRVLDAIPECALHGSCVTNALEWIEKQKILNEPLP